jgi:hypothetical protein
MIRVFTAALIAVMMTCGCICVQSQEPEIFNDDAFKSTGHGIVLAITMGNYPQFAQLVGEPEIARDAESFARSCEAMRKKYGKPIMFRFLTFLHTPMLVNQIWVIDFVRNGSDGKMIRQQQMFQLLFRDDNGKAKLVGMRFI